MFTNIEKAKFGGSYSSKFGNNHKVGISPMDLNKDLQIKVKG